MMYTELMKRVCYVYFAEQEGTGLIKIGHSLAPKQRMKSLKSDYGGTEFRLLTFTPGNMNDEIAMHVRFQEHRVRRELFTPHTSLMDFVYDLRRMEQKKLINACQASKQLFKYRPNSNNY